MSEKRAPFHTKQKGTACADARKTLYGGMQPSFRIKRIAQTGAHAVA